MHPSNFGYSAPHSLDEALGLLHEHGDEAKLLAGGHSLIPAMKLRLTEPAHLIDLAQISQLRGIRIEDSFLIIGALTTHTEVASSESVRLRMPGLAETASMIGDLQVRNRGTIGGSVAHADPAADLPVMLTALNASVTLISSSGERAVPVDDFFVDFFTTALADHEILTEIRIPLPGSRTGTGYAKLPHPASGYVVVSAAAVLSVDGAGVCQSARVVIGGVGSVPHRPAATETTLQGKSLTQDVINAAADKAKEDTQPHADAFADEDYKRQMTTVYARRAMEAAAARTRGTS